MRDCLFGVSLAARSDGGLAFPRWGLEGFRQLDPRRPALVAGEDAECEPAVRSCFDRSIAVIIVSHPFAPLVRAGRGRRDDFFAFLFSRRAACRARGSTAR